MTKLNKTMKGEVRKQNKEGGGLEAEFPVGRLALQREHKKVRGRHRRSKE